MNVVRLVFCRTVLSVGWIAGIGGALVGQQTGLHYYAVENLATGVVEQRGTAGGAGVAFSNLALGAQGRFRLWLLQAATLRLARVEVTTGISGSSLQVPPFELFEPNPHDDDNDGLPNECEFVMGTLPNIADSDGDGVADGAEVQAGTNPGDGTPARTGIVAAADTPGQALDVVAADNIAVVADGNGGVSVFNVFNTMDPKIVAQVGTPAPALRAAYSERWAAVACGPAGLGLIDLRDPPAATLTRLVSALALGGDVSAVAAAAGVAYCSTTTGFVAAVDMRSGQVLKVRNLQLPIADLQISGDHLFVLTTGCVLQALAAEPGALTPLGQVGSPFAIAGRRLFVGGGIAYAVHGTGANAFGISNPAVPTLLQANNTPNGFQQFVSNGSGLGIAIAGESANPSATDRHLWLYSLANPQVTTQFLTEFRTPGPAKAVAVFNGLAYVADGDAGLQVINYRSYDTSGVPPQITLSPSFGLTAAESGKRVFVRALTADDVQVRNVEFYIDDQRVLTDGGYPFEHYFVVPTLAQQSSFRLRARASDTGGNATWSTELLITITADGTAPSVVSTAPRDLALVSSVTSVVAFFSEPMAPATLTTGSFRLVDAGPDWLFGTPDDVVRNDGPPEFRVDSLGAYRTFASGLSPGRYEATLTTTVADASNNLLPVASSWQFGVYERNGVDSDGDGLPDFLELLLGLNPNSADSDGDTIPDGQEDADQDGLSNAGELLVGTDLRSTDTDGNGIVDGLEDPDFDRLGNGVEVQAGTNPLLRDTDGDGFDDREELNPGGVPRSDPLLASSTPLRGWLTPVTVRQNARPDVLTRNVVSSASAQNQAAPEQVSRQTESRVTSVRNDN